MYRLPKFGILGSGLIHFIGKTALGKTEEETMRLQ